jgi:L-threonylcarbamoyladenylate synthase
LAQLGVLKGREARKAISVLILDEAMLSLLCADVPPAARKLIEKHWPGPLTMALPARPDLPAALVSEGCVAVRVSPHPIVHQLLTAFGGPITTTSANPAGSPAATTAAQVRAYFERRCHVLDGGSTPGGVPSTLVRVRGGHVEVLRAGAVKIG